jgi:hypothetical protein
METVVNHEAEARERNRGVYLRSLHVFFFCFRRLCEVQIGALTPGLSPK